MSAAMGDGAAPESDAPENIRRRIRSRVPHVVARVSLLLRLAALGARGPDPEAALAHLRAAQRTLTTFVVLTTAKPRK
jgi:hypothetical protein